jgi:hypothetical protein
MSYILHTCNHICICVYIYLLGLFSTFERAVQTLLFWTWLTWLYMMITTSFHLPKNDIVSVF